MLTEGEGEYTIIHGHNSAILNGVSHYFDKTINLHGNILRNDCDYGGLISWIGDTARTIKGVLIIDFHPNDTNRIEFTNIDGKLCSYPFVVAGTITFGDLSNDPNAYYAVHFTDDIEERERKRVLKEREEGLNLLTKKWWQIWKWK